MAVRRQVRELLEEALRERGFYPVGPKEEDQWSCDGWGARSEPFVDAVAWSLNEAGEEDEYGDLGREGGAALDGGPADDFRGREP